MSLTRVLFAFFCMAAPMLGAAAAARVRLSEAPTERTFLKHESTEESAADECASCSWETDNLTGRPDYRTSFHFQPPPTSHVLRGGWLNDPNGPLWFNGFYHLFYQHNDGAAVWGNISWGHAVSRDLIAWAHLPIALRPSDALDAGGVWTGSATITESGTPGLLYTCAGAAGTPQLVCLAEPVNATDPLLLEWAKSPNNPVVPAPPPGVSPQLFRDPTSAWKAPDGTWRMLVGGQRQVGEGVAGGAALLFKSAAGAGFANWTFESDLLEAAGSPMWECPDLFPLPPHPGRKQAPIPGLSPEGFPALTARPPAAARRTGPARLRSIRPTRRSRPHGLHVLKASVLDPAGFSGRDRYLVGRYDRNGRFSPEADFTGGESDLKAGPLLDAGVFYASKTFYDPPRGRRVLWGWVRETDAIPSAVARGWAGLMALPRVVMLDPHAQHTGSALLTPPVPELVGLRRRSYGLENATLPPPAHPSARPSTRDLTAELGLCGTRLDVEIEFAPPAMVESVSGDAIAGPFGLRVLSSPDGREHTDIWVMLSHRGGGVGAPAGASAAEAFGHGRHLESAPRSTWDSPPPANDSSPWGASPWTAAGSPLTVATLAADVRQSSLAPDADSSVHLGPLRLAPSDTGLTLRVIVDGGVVEAYAQGGRSVVTARSYPTLKCATRVLLFNAGPAAVKVTRLTAHKMAPAESCTYGGKHGAEGRQSGGCAFAKL